VKEAGSFDFWLRFGTVTGCFSNMLLRRSLAKTKKSSLRMATVFFKRSILFFRVVLQRTMECRSFFSIADWRSGCHPKYSPTQNAENRNQPAQTYPTGKPIYAEGIGAGKL
jgi:hypothetical protein